MADVQGLYEKTRSAVRQSALIAEQLRMCNLDAGVREYQEFLQSFQSVTAALLGDDRSLAARGIGASPDYIVEIMRGLLEAQEQKDYVLLADLLSLQAQPFLQELLEQIRSAEEQAFFSDYLEQNLRALSGPNPVLCERIRSLRQEDWQDLVVEPTVSGYPTLCITRDGKRFYLHSNQDPYAEARAWVRVLPDGQSKGYHMLGCGLGYHILALCGELKESYPVHVYEPDERLLYLMLRYVDVEKYLRAGLLILHEDEGLRALSEAIVRTGQKLCIHYPSLRLIKDERLRQSFEQFFLQDSSYRNARILLQGNFDANMESMRANPERFLTADALCERFRDKTVYIVAAGPSLDRNVSQLKECAGLSGSLIVACGTVFRKLLGMGIRPDYLIVTDANPRVLFQIQGQEHSDVPMLMLSTANHGFAVRYQAIHYMLFQEGYPRAEEEAKRLGCMCVQTGGSVMTTTLDAMLRFGAKKLVFVGLDLAFTNSLAHASGTSNRIATDTGDLVPVKAWDGGTVYADSKFILYRTWMERRLKEKDARKAEVINATEGGSYIQGMRHIPLAEVLGG